MAVTASPSTPTPERVLVASMPLIARLAGMLARRHRLDASEGEEFAAWATARLVEDDYAILRKFGGRSSVETYLTAVVQNLFRDYRNSRWGRWRPSAEATRLGPLAVRLEELLVRDGRPVLEAVRYLCSRDTSLDERELGALVKRLPRRTPIREVSLDGGGDSAQEVPDPAAEEPGAAEVVRRVQDVLGEVVASLPPEDGVIVRMRFWDGHTVADIARALHLDQKALYRRLEQLRVRLRAAMEARGIDRALVLEAFGREVSW
jgi:RNA polymerase sigma factor for flagellar operon FliA